MTAANNTSYLAMLKEAWPQDDIIDEIYDPKMAFYGLVQKDTDFYENVRHIAVGTGTTSGLSAGFADAKTAQQPTTEFKFDVTTVTYFSLFSLARKLMRQSSKKKGAIMPALERQMRGALKGWKRRTSIYLFNTNVGSIGKILTDQGGTATLPTGGTQVLTSSQIQIDAAADMRHFINGTTVDFSLDNTGSAGVRTMLSPLVATSFDRDNGIITFNQAINSACPSHGATDYVYFRGDYGKIVSGVPAWAPITAPTSTTFFGLDRTRDVQLLGGWRVPCKNKSLRAAAMTTAKVLFEIGADPGHAFYSTDDFLTLQLELESSGSMKRVTEPAAKIGSRSFGQPYEGISLPSPGGGEIKCFGNIDIPVNYSWMTNLSTWTFGSTGDAPYLDEGDGNELLRDPDADALGGRVVGDFQLYNEAPAETAVSLLTT